MANEGEEQAPGINVLADVALADAALANVGGEVEQAIRRLFLGMYSMGCGCEATPSGRSRSRRPFEAQLQENVIKYVQDYPDLRIENPAVLDEALESIDRRILLQWRVRRRFDGNDCYMWLEDVGGRDPYYVHFGHLMPVQPDEQQEDEMDWP